MDNDKVEELAKALHINWEQVDSWDESSRRWREELREHARASLAWFDANNPLAAECARLSAPVADTGTLEKLADIAHLEFQKYYNGHYPMKEDFRRVVTAILRAAHGNTVALHQASMEFREVPDPSEELVSAYCNDEVDTFTDKFLGDLYLGIKRTAMPTDETRIEWLAEIRCAQKIFDDFARGMRGQSAPIADADTLEKLAEIGRQAREDQRLSDKDNGYDITEEIKRQDLAQVTAILRAAKPYVDMTDDEADNIAMHFGHSELMRIANSRIRYGVELPESLQNMQQLPTTSVGGDWTCGKCGSRIDSSVVGAECFLCKRKEARRAGAGAG